MLGPWAQPSSDLGSRRRARIGYDGDDLEEWRGWRGVETSRSGRLTEGYSDLTEREQKEVVSEGWSSEVHHREVREHWKAR